MIYSRWNPTSGKYDYFEAKGVVNGINDDLPKPEIPRADNPIGVASVLCGRPIPSGARHIGSGLAARGVLAVPLAAGQHGQLMGGDAAISAQHIGHLLLGALVGGVVVYGILRWRKR